MAFSYLGIRPDQLKSQRAQGGENDELEGDIDRVERAMKVAEEISKPSGAYPGHLRGQFDRRLTDEQWQKEAQEKLAALQS